MQLRAGIFCVLLLAILAVSRIAVAQDPAIKSPLPLAQPDGQSAPTAPTEPQPAKEAIVRGYVTPDRYDGLYRNVLDQYVMLSPHKAQAETLIDDETFENQIFGLVQKNALSTFSLDELRAMAKFIDSPAGQSLSDKVNRLGMNTRSGDLSDSEKKALADFKSSPEGRSVAGKSLKFASLTLSDIMRTFLIRQSMGNTLGQ